jgi:Fur family ferric uptake transcriptional regulator
MDTLLEILNDHGLRNTKVRRDVLKVFLDQEDALSHQVIEQKMDKVDRITLYRTLKTFEKKGIIHKAIDGGEKLKYALCAAGCDEHKHTDRHAHFHCEKCDRTLCLDEVSIPSVMVPANYTKNHIHLIINGICAACK